MILGKRLLHTFSRRIPLRYSVVLTPEIVKSTLLNCPSDVIGLSFFLWCARQPNYFHDPKSFDCMVPVVGRLSLRFESVKGIVQGLERFGCLKRPQTFLILLRIYCRGGMYELALETYMEMVHCGFTPNTFAQNMIMDVLFKIGGVDTALAVLRSTHDPNFWTFNIAICNLCKLNQLSCVVDVLRVMVRQGFHPNVDTFTMVLSCFCKDGRLVESLQILGLMIKLGFPPSVTVWSILIDGFCKVGKLDMAIQLLEEMIGSGHSPNVVTYTSLIKGFMGCRMVDRAIGIFNTMESEGCMPDLVLYNILIDGFTKAGRYGDALDIFSDLRERNLEPDSYTICSILSTICSSQKFALFPRLVTGFSSADVVVCNCLITYFFKSGSPSRAVEFYHAMIDKGFTPDGYTYVGILGGLCRAGRTEEAINEYYKLVRNNFDLDTHVHTIVIGELLKMGKFHRARAIRLFRKAVVEKFPLDVVSYTVAIHGLFKGGRIEEAHRLFCQMKEVGLVPTTYTCNVMLSSLCKARNVQLIKWLLRDMDHAGIEQDCITFNTLVGFCFKSNRIRSAFGLCIQMQDLGLALNESNNALMDYHLAHTGDIGDTYQPLLNGYREHALYIDNSSTCDLPEMSASVG